MKKPIKIKPPVKKELKLVPSLKSESEKGLVSIGFDDAKQPIQSIKKPKKVFQKLPKSEIQGQKSVLLPKSASFPTISNDFVAEELKEIKPVLPISSPLDFLKAGNDLNEIQDLEKEIQLKMQLLEQRKIEEAERKLKEEEEKIRQEEERRLKEEEEVERVKQEEEKKKEEECVIESFMEDSTNEIKLNSYEYIDIRICPVCSGKLKRAKVKKNGLIFIQKVKCKNIDCNFEREIAFSL